VGETEKGRIVQQAVIRTRLKVSEYSFKRARESIPRNFGKNHEDKNTRSKIC
jgi:hypothetical protein